jgi:hypothetical protein
MKSQISLIKLTLCGPGDVLKEIDIAKEVISEWNLRHGESYGFWVKHQHWLTDTYPKLGDRPQGVVNNQIIDDADALVAIFWSRFGTSTGIADSGTEEEIRRGVKLNKKVLVYFSDMEPIPPSANSRQLNRLWKFRQDLQTLGLSWKFNSRHEFRTLFSNHLALLLNQFKAPTTVTRNKLRASPRGPIQKVKGTKNIQIIGDGNAVVFSDGPTAPKKIVERLPGSVTPEEKYQIRNLIEQLADGEVGVSREQAFSRWWGQFYNRFKVSTYEDVPSAEMPNVVAWHNQQIILQKNQRKIKAPDQRRIDCTVAIKSAMREMGRTNEDYYPELSRRLRMRKPFASLKDLTNKDIERVYRMVLGDRRR